MIIRDLHVPSNIIFIIVIKVTLMIIMMMMTMMIEKKNNIMKSENYEMSSGESGVLTGRFGLIQSSPTILFFSSSLNRFL